MLRHKWTLIAVFLVILLLASACNQPLLKGSSSDGGSDMVTIQLVTGNPDQSAMDAVIKAFMDKYPNYRVIRTQVDLGQASKAPIKNAIQKGNADVVSTMWLESGDLESLEPYLARSGTDLGPYGSGLDLFRVDGKLYDLPILVTGYPVYFNQDAFSTAHLPLPHAGWTWEEFRTAAARLTRTEGGTAVPAFSSAMAFFLTEAWISEKAGRPYWEADDSVVGEGLQLLETWVKTDKSVAFVQSSMEPVFDGRSAMSMSSASGINQTDPKIHLVPLPTVSGVRPALEVELQAYGIASTSKNPKAAWEFLRFASGEEGAIAIARAGRMPAYNTEAVRGVFQERNLTEIDNLYKSMWVIQPPMARAKRSGDYVRSKIQQVLNGKSAASAFAEYQQEMAKARAANAKK